MRIFSLIIILIIYYISTFLISFALLAKSVVNNDPVSLERYINVKELRNNFYGDIYEFSSNLINVMDKNIRIKSESIELAGELTPTFLEKLFSRMSNNISTDFSSPEIMLYFYFNSIELSTYLNKSFTHFGDYNFEKYLLEKQSENTDYFFLTSPIHFKIDVKHQDIPFILILKFNGYMWKVQKITIPYKELIDPKNISLSN